MDTNEIRRLARNAVRKGTIFAIDPKVALCRVAVGDPDADGGGLKTNWIPWLAAAAGTTRDWLPPTKGEQVILLCPMGDPAQAVALRGIFSDASPAPDDQLTRHLRVYPDGARIAYDHAAHTLSATLPTGGTVTVVAPGAVTVRTETATVEANNLTLDAKQTTCTGELLVKGAFAFESGMTGKGGAGGATMKIDGGAEFTKDVSAGGVSLTGHKHQAQGERAPTSPPIKGAA